MSTFSGDAQSADKHAVARKSTFVSIVLNVVLATFQIVVGVIAHSQALIADGVHSISDLISDFVVLVANRHSGASPDADHNYGHSRYETVASLFLGAILIAVGVGMLWRAGDRLVNLENIPAVHFSALLVALTVLVSKEALFRYMLREARRVRGLQHPPARHGPGAQPAGAPVDRDPVGPYHSKDSVWMRRPSIIASATWRKGARSTSLVPRWIRWAKRA